MQNTSAKVGAVNYELNHYGNDSDSAMEISTQRNDNRRTSSNSNRSSTRRRHHRHHHTRQSHDHRHHHHRRRRSRSRSHLSDNRHIKRKNHYRKKHHDCRCRLNDMEEKVRRDFELLSFRSRLSDPRNQIDFSRVTVVLDFSYAGLMSLPQERRCALEALACYNAKMKYKKPVQLYFCSFHGHQRAEVELFQAIAGGNNLYFHTEPFTEIFDSNKVIYLSNDSPNIIDCIQEDVVYVIGAIEDNDKRKGISLELALSSDVQHARLRQSNLDKSFHISRAFKMLLNSDPVKAGPKRITLGYQNFLMARGGATNPHYSIELFDGFHSPTNGGGLLDAGPSGLPVTSDSTISSISGPSRLSSSTLTMAADPYYTSMSSNPLPTPLSSATDFSQISFSDHTDSLVDKIGKLSVSPRPGHFDLDPSGSCKAESSRVSSSMRSIKSSKFVSQAISVISSVFKDSNEPL